MGLISSSMNLIKLNRLRFELEEKIESCNSKKMKLLTNASELEDLQNGLDPKSPEVKKLQERQQRLKALEKKLDDQITRLQTQMKMVEANFQQEQQNVDKNIQYFYSK